MTIELIQAIVRQTTVLIAQLATSVRRPLGRARSADRAKAVVKPQQAAKAEAAAKPQRAAKAEPGGWAERAAIARWVAQAERARAPMFS